MTGGTNMDVLLIGIDACCERVLDEQFEAGRLPALASIVEDGASGPLTSQIPPWTPSAWPSMYTGVNPGKHGVYGFVAYDGYDWRVVTRDDVDAHAIWTLLDEQGYSSVVVNVPVTNPPDDIDGAIVPGFLCPEDPPCHPAGILDDVRDHIGAYRVHPEYARSSGEPPREEKLDEYRALVRMRGEAFRYLANRFDPDFGFVQFQKTDTVFHEFGGDQAAVTDVYQSTDEQIEAIIRECDPDTIVVASDHGIGPYEKQEFRLNEYLRDNGYVTAAKGGRGMPSWDPIQDQLVTGNDSLTWERGILERMAALAARVGVTTTRIGAGLSRVGLDGLARRCVPDGVVRTGTEQVDFAASTAYIRARTELGVRLNLQGREPNGVVPPSEYEAVRDELIDVLEAARAPDGDPVFETVAPREAYFSGPHVDEAVDIVTIPADFDHFLSAQLMGDQFGESTEPWNHKLDGIVAATGQGIDTSASLDRAHLFDVAPTILAAMGLPTSDRMDGAVLPIVENGGEERYPPYDGETARDEGRAAVEDRLVELGYLE